jgi:hypothetical protein
MEGVINESNVTHYKAKFALGGKRVRGETNIVYPTQILWWVCRESLSREAIDAQFQVGFFYSRR